jgi:hypothetical protein
MRVLPHAFLTMLAVTAGVSLPASAQPAPGQQASPLTCDDFIYRGQGAWSPAHPITLNGVTMGGGMTFTEGVSFGGANLAHALNTQCPHSF